MIVGLQPGVGQVAENARSEEQGPGEPGAEIAAEEGNENASYGGIAEEMKPVPSLST